MSTARIRIAVALAALAAAAFCRAAAHPQQEVDIPHTLLRGLVAANLYQEPEVLHILQAQVQREKSLDQPDYQRHRLTSTNLALAAADIEYVKSLGVTLRLRFAKHTCISGKSFSVALTSAKAGIPKNVSTTAQPLDTSLFLVALSAAPNKDLYFVTTASGCITLVEIKQK
jgi:hypothetical protein